MSSKECNNAFKESAMASYGIVLFAIVLLIAMGILYNFFSPAIINSVNAF